MKCVTDNCIKLEAIEHFNNDPMKIYKLLAEGKNKTFDLTTVKSKFKNNKNYTISNVTDFIRTLSFKGKLNEVYNSDI